VRLLDRIAIILTFDNSAQRSHKEKSIPTMAAAMKQQQPPRHSCDA
jgi:hypothetical protein